MAKKNYWTEEIVETLKKLVEQGHAASAIARKLPKGATRNSVIGKVFRMGLKLKGQNQRSQPAVISIIERNTKRNVAVIAHQVKLRKAEALEREDPETVFAKPQEGALWCIPREGNCKYPFGDPKDRDSYNLCGHPKERGSYCTKHADLCGVPDKGMAQGPVWKSFRQEAMGR